MLHEACGYANLAPASQISSRQSSASFKATIVTREVLPARTCSAHEHVRVLIRRACPRARRQ
eukprot:1486734-Pleurochrysis_carterae.AAC.1